MSDGKDEDGTHAGCLRVAPGDAWRYYPSLEYARTGAVYAAVVLDVDDPMSFFDARWSGRVPKPNWSVKRRSTGHLHACYCLASPVYRGPDAAAKPLQTLARIEAWMVTTTGADAGYSGVLSHNPMRRHGKAPDFATHWLRHAPYTLDELRSHIPKGWRRPVVPVGPVERHNTLRAALMRASGQPRHWGDAQHVRDLAAVMQAGWEAEHPGGGLPADEAERLVEWVIRTQRREYRVRAAGGCLQGDPVEAWDQKRQGAPRGDRGSGRGDPPARHRGGVHAGRRPGYWASLRHRLRDRAERRSGRDCARAENRSGGRPANQKRYSPLGGSSAYPLLFEKPHCPVPSPMISFRNLRASDLADDVLLAALLDHAIGRGWWGLSEADRLAFWSLAERALEVGQVPGAMFHSSIQRDLRGYVSAAQEDRAARRLAAMPRVSRRRTSKK